MPPDPGASDRGKRTVACNFESLGPDETHNAATRDAVHRTHKATILAAELLIFARASLQVKASILLDCFFIFFFSRFCGSLDVSLCPPAAWVYDERGDVFSYVWYAVWCGALHAIAYGIGIGGFSCRSPMRDTIDTPGSLDLSFRCTCDGDRMSVCGKACAF